MNVVIITISLYFNCNFSCLQSS